jgi:hypothetical protein
MRSEVDEMKAVTRFYTDGGVGSDDQPVSSVMAPRGARAFILVFS